jgi:hypothetical protein
MAGLESGFYGARLEHVHDALTQGLKTSAGHGQHAVAFGTAVKSTSQTKEGRTAVSLTGKGRKKQVAVDLVVAADGVGSNVRHNLMDGAPETPIKARRTNDRFPLFIIFTPASVCLCCLPIHSLTLSRALSVSPPTVFPPMASLSLPSYCRSFPGLACGTSS